MLGIATASFITKRHRTVRHSPMSAQTTRGQSEERESGRVVIASSGAVAPPTEFDMGNGKSRKNRLPVLINPLTGRPTTLSLVLLFLALALAYYLVTKPRDGPAQASLDERDKHPKFQHVLPGVERFDAPGDQGLNRRHRPDSLPPAQDGLAGPAELNDPRDRPDAWQNRPAPDQQQPLPQQPDRVIDESRRPVLNPPQPGRDLDVPDRGAAPPIDDRLRQPDRGDRPVVPNQQQWAPNPDQRQYPVDQPQAHDRNQDNPAPGALPKVDPPPGPDRPVDPNQQRWVPNQDRRLFPVNQPQVHDRNHEENPSRDALPKVGRAPPGPDRPAPPAIDRQDGLSPKQGEPNGGRADPEANRPPGRAEPAPRYRHHEERAREPYKQAPPHRVRPQAPMVDINNPWNKPQGHLQLGGPGLGKPPFALAKQRPEPPARKFNHRFMQEHAGLDANNKVTFRNKYPKPKEFPVALLQRPRVRCPDKPYILFLVTCLPTEVLGRAALRRSWGSPAGVGESGAMAMTWRTVFAMGREEGEDEHIGKEADNHGDILQGDFDDLAYEVTRKVMMGLAWAKDLPSPCQPRFVFKTNLKVYINLPVLIPWIQGLGMSSSAYVGKLLHEDRPNREWDSPLFVSHDDYRGRTFPDLARGPLYLLSMDVVTGMVSAFDSVTPIAMEDAYVGLLADFLEVPVTNDDHFILIKKPSNFCHYRNMMFIFDVQPTEVMHVYKIVEEKHRYNECTDREF